MSTAAEMSWEEIKALVAELAIQSKETDHKFQETDRKFQETDRKFQETRELIERLSRESALRMERLDREMGRLTNRLGEFVEEMVKPALVELFRARGLRVHRTTENLTYTDDNDQLVAQVDLLAIDGDTAVAVECKSHLSVDDVNEHLERLAHFKEWWPDYRHYKLHGAVAAMVIPKDVASYAYRKGLFVLAPSGETMCLLNDEKFKPRAW